MASAPVTLRDARLLYAASIITTTSYGIYVVLAFTSIHLQLRRKTPHKLLLVYSIVMFCISTAWLILTTITNELVLVEAMYNEAYRRDLYCSGTNAASVTLSSILLLGSNMSLLYRTYMLYNHSFVALSLPLLTWLAYIGIAITGNLACTNIHNQVFTSTAIVTVYYSLPVSTNILCTILIVGKLIVHQRALRRSGIQRYVETRGPTMSKPRSDYRSIIEVLSESGLLYAIAGVVNAAFAMRGHPLTNISSPVFGAMAYLTEAHITLRLALGAEDRAGRGAEKDEGTGQASSALVFGAKSVRDSARSSISASAEEG